MPREEIINSELECWCGCGLTFIKYHSSQKYAPDCQTSPWERYRINQGRYQKKYKQHNYRKRIPKPEKYPLHKCSRPACNRKTTNRFLCTECHANHREIPEIYKDELICISIPGTRKKLNAAAEASRMVMIENLKTYSPDEYSQEELRKLVPSLQ